MRARAPGKIVLSGAYAVLEGAPAIVAAVDRYVLADSARAADFVTEEVRAALASGALDAAPWFDASALRAAAADGTSRKLGLGSSAAILVASLAARLPGGSEDSAARVFPAAFAAHKAAQPRGSGIDVAASAFGAIRAAIREGGLEVAKHALPEGAVVEVFASRVPASTASLVGKVRELAGANPGCYRELIEAAAAGARAAIEAASVPALVAALGAQFDALAWLGAAARAPIVTDEVAALRPLAADERSAFGPSGAGGGDVAIFVGAAPSSEGFRERARTLGYERLDLAIGAAGVERLLP